MALESVVLCVDTVRLMSGEGLLRVPNSSDLGFPSTE